MIIIRASIFLSIFVSYARTFLSAPQIGRWGPDIILSIDNTVAFRWTNPCRISSIYTQRGHQFHLHMFYGGILVLLLHCTNKQNAEYDFITVIWLGLRVCIYNINAVLYTPFRLQMAHTPVGFPSRTIFISPAKAAIIPMRQNSYQNQTWQPFNIIICSWRTAIAYP